MIENPLVTAVTVRGSTPAGRAVARKAGEMIKKSVLELGGSDAYVVLADADLEATVSTCVTSRLLNTSEVTERKAPPDISASITTSHNGRRV